MWSVKRLTVFLILAVALCGSGTAIAFDETDLKKLEALGNCEGCDLSEANLSEADLRYVKLVEANLSGANLRFSVLENANLMNANLENANLNGADLSGAKLEGADLVRWDLGDAFLCKTLTPWGEDNSGCEK